MAAEYNGGRLAERLSRGPALLMDGATGTELERRGVGAAPPLWSARALAEAPQAVLEIHREYVEAGAELLTANTFRTAERSLAAAGWSGRSAELTTLAVQLARQAANEVEREVFVVGSAAPLEDCYCPERVPADPILAAEHGRHAAMLARAGVDAVLVETMNTAREAASAARAAREAGLACLVSFVCDPQARLLSGEPLADAVAAVLPAKPIFVGVNCLPVPAVPPCLRVLARCGIPFGAFPNLGEPEPSGWKRAGCSPDELAAAAEGWLTAGARLVGGCCGTTASHVAALGRAVSIGGS